MPALTAMRAAPSRCGAALAPRALGEDLLSRFNEVFSGILIVRSFTMEEAEKKRFLRDVSEANTLVIRGVATDTGYGAASNTSDRLAEGAQPLPELGELFCHRRVILIRQGELGQQFQRALISQAGTIEMPPLLLSIRAVLQSRRIQMPPHHRHLRPEMLDASEFLHAGAPRTKPMPGLGAAGTVPSPRLPANLNE